MSGSRKPSDYFEDLQRLLSDPATKNSAFEQIHKQSGINKETLRKAYYRAFGACLGNQAFPTDIEKAIVVLCLIMSHKKDPLTPGRLCNLVGNTFGVKVGPKWCSGFLSRHSDLIICHKPGVLSPIRGRNDLIERTRVLVSQWSELVRRKFIHEDNFFVFDETRITRPFDKLPVVTSKLIASPHKETTRGEAFGTFMPFSRPIGDTPFRVYIFQHDENKEMPCARELRQPRGIKRVYMSSDTGYLNKEGFSYIMDEFCEWWSTISGGRDCYLLSDNLGAHMDEETIIKCAQKRVFLWNIVPGSSYWLQVHDDSPFGSLKRIFQIICSEVNFKKDYSAEQRRVLLAGCFYEAESRSFTRENLKHAFDSVGLWPFQPEKILQRAEEQNEVKSDDDGQHLLDLVKRMLEQDEELMEQRRLSVLEWTEMRKVPLIGRYDHSPLKKIRKLDDRKSLSPATKFFQSIPQERMFENIQKGTTCACADCTATFQSSKKWKYCFSCGNSWCPRHAKYYNHHICSTTE